MSKKIRLGQSWYRNAIFSNILQHTQNQFHVWSKTRKGMVFFLRGRCRPKSESSQHNSIVQAKRMMLSFFWREKEGSWLVLSRQEKKLKGSQVVFCTLHSFKLLKSNSKKQQNLSTSWKLYQNNACWHATLLHMMEWLWNISK